MAYVTVIGEDPEADLMTNKTTNVVTDGEADAMIKVLALLLEPFDKLTKILIVKALFDIDLLG